MTFVPTFEDYEDAAYKLDSLIVLLDFLMEFMVEHDASTMDAPQDLAMTMRRVEAASDEILTEHREELEGLYVRCEDCGSTFLASSGLTKCERFRSENEEPSKQEIPEDPLNPSPQFFDGLTCGGNLIPLQAPTHLREAANIAALEQPWVRAWEVLAEYQKRIGHDAIAEPVLSAVLKPTHATDSATNELPPLFMSSSEVIAAFDWFFQRESEWLLYNMGHIANFHGRLKLTPRGTTLDEMHKDYLSVREMLWASYLGVLHETRIKCEQLGLPRMAPVESRPVVRPDSTVHVQEFCVPADDTVMQPSPSSASEEAGAENVFRFVDSEWEICFDGHTFHPPDTVSVRQWHALISACGQVIRPCDFPGVHGDNPNRRVKENLNRFTRSLSKSGRRSIAKHLDNALRTSSKGLAYVPVPHVEWRCETSTRKEKGWNKGPVTTNTPITSAPPASD